MYNNRIGLQFTLLTGPHLYNDYTTPPHCPTAGKTVLFHSVDLLEKEKVRDVFSKYPFHTVIHCAGLKAVGESVQRPLRYYHVNINIALVLLEVMKEFSVRNLIFSSSATVYGTPERLPIDESHPTGNCSNPYGKTKYFVEEIIKDFYASEEGWNVILLRYFNPVGAHESGEMGEDPRGVPNNLMPFISQVVVGLRPQLVVFGDDYETVDGTGVRDYIHVVDLAEGHVAALTQIVKNCGLKVYNLCSGKGVSVLEFVRAMEKATQKKIPYVVAGRRVGDVAAVYADPSLVERELGWRATRDTDKCCEDAWRWQSRNPTGYGT